MVACTTDFAAEGSNRYKEIFGAFRAFDHKLKIESSESFNVIFNLHVSIMVQNIDKL